jgi:hypothetical protein
MSESPETDRADTPVDEDELREHSQDPAEGPDDESEQGDDVPRVHAEDPAEG